MVDVKRRQRAFALSLAALTVAAISVLPIPAGADAIADKQAEANAIAGKIDQLNHTIEHNAEAANEAQIELDGLNQQVQDAQGKVATAQAEHDKHEGELRDYAVNAYVHGTDAVSQAQALTGSDPGNQGQRQGYLTAASGNRQQLVDSLRATEEDLNARIGQLNQSKGAAEAKAKDLKNQQDAAQSAVQQQQSLYNEAQGELATLVQQAQQRAAAEQQAAAEARAAAAQAQAQAQAAQAQAASRGRSGRDRCSRCVRAEGTGCSRRRARRAGRGRPVGPRAVSQRRRRCGHRRSPATARQAVRVGCRGAERIRLLGPDGVGVASRWSEPAALLGCAVRLDDAHLDVGHPAR